MRILHAVEQYEPSVGGMQQVVRQLSERLVRLGHEVTVVTSAHPDRRWDRLNGVRIREFGISGNFTRGIQGDSEPYLEFLKHSGAEITAFFAAQQWTADLALPRLAEIPGKKVFVPTGYSGLPLPEYREYFERLPGWLHFFDAHVFLSNQYRDIEFARDHKIRNLHVIPNGAGSDEFAWPPKHNIRRLLGISGNTRLILHVGSFTGLKGHAEAVRIYEKSRACNTVLLMTGTGMDPFRVATENHRRFKDRVRDFFYGKRLVVASLSRPQTVAAFQAADLFLFPSNIECSPLVLFECLAGRTAYLTTDVGNAREITEWSGCGRLLPTVIDASGYSHAKIRESAEMMDELLSSASEREAIAERGHEAWKKRFTWEIITRQYESLYDSLLK